MNTERFGTIIKNMEAYNNCDANFAAALNDFKFSLSLSLNITTRNLWRLVHLHLDEPLRAVIDLERCELVKKLLLDFKLSNIDHTKPIYCFDSDQWAAQGHLITKDLVSLSKTETVPVDMEVERILHNMELWYKNIRYANHCSQGSIYRTVGGNNSIVFRGTLDTVIPLISTLMSFKPTRVLHKGYDGVQPYGKIEGKESMYCELCWRLSISAMDRVYAKKTGTKHNFRLNDQYCEYHDPSDRTSQYKTDLPYREVFQHELKSKDKWLQVESNFAFQFEPDDFSRGHEMDARKAIYDLVHAKLKPTRGKGNNIARIKEPVYLLRVRDRLSFDEIAIKLGIKKNSAERAWMELENLFNTHRRESYICDYTGEVVDMLPDGDVLIAKIKALLAENVPLKDIAAETGLFTYTVRAIKIRIDKIEQSIKNIDKFKEGMKANPYGALIIEKLDETKHQLQQYYQSGRNVMLVNMIERDIKAKKELHESFICKLIKPMD